MDDLCPLCGSTSVAKILYGLPDFSDELMQQVEAGRVALGGCCIELDEHGDPLNPELACKECGSMFDRSGRVHSTEPGSLEEES